MAEQFPSLQDEHIRFIEQQHLFFVGTAGSEGFINVSPKGMDTFRIIEPSEVAWLNLTGSGNESAAHVAENGRMTIMFCSFGKQPLIMRLYGQAEVVHSRDSDWPELLARFPAQAGTRQIFRLKLDMVQTSCGYAVPRYDLRGERPTLKKWAENKGQDGLEEYWREKNMTTLDGKPTGIFDDAVDEPAVTDANGNVLVDGDTVTVIKDLKVKGSSAVVKVGTRVKNIRLVDGDHDIDCKVDGIGAMKLKSEFVKKA